METLAALVQKWTDEARHLRDRYGLETAARICEAHANELQVAVVGRESEILTVAQAAEESGYSEQHLRALIADGHLTNAGQKGRPRVRRRDLPLKGGTRRANGPHRHSKDKEVGSTHARGRAFNAHRIVHGS